MTSKPRPNADIEHGTDIDTVRSGPNLDIEHDRNI